MAASDAFAWQMPQGGLDAGEDPEAAARRELYEETGIRSVELLSELDGWLTYDFPPEILGKRFKNNIGQAQRWFFFEARDDEVEPTPDGDEFDDWKWVKVPWLVDQVVEFRKPSYQRVLGARS